MDSQAITALRFATDAVVRSPPSAWTETLRQIAQMSETRSDTRDALAVLEEVLTSLTDQEPGVRLLKASEELIESTEQLKQVAGAALYSSLLSHRDLRHAIRDALQGTRTSRLLEQYRKAGVEGRLDPYKR